MRFPERLEQDLAAIGARAEDVSQALVPMLRAVQNEVGWIGDEALAEVAMRAGADVEDTANIASYFGLRRAPPAAKFVVEVCVNVSCRRRGGEAILARCKERLGVEVGETTADGRFLLDEVVCLKACESGPAVRVNWEIRDELTVDGVDELLTRLEGA